MFKALFENHFLSFDFFAEIYCLISNFRVFKYAGINCRGTLEQVCKLLKLTLLLMWRKNGTSRWYWPITPILFKYIQNTQNTLIRRRDLTSYHHWSSATLTMCRPWEHGDFSFLQLLMEPFMEMASLVSGNLSYFISCKWQWRIAQLYFFFFLYLT